MHGDAISVAVKGGVDDWTAQVNSLRSLVAGAIGTANVTVHDALGAVKAYCWTAGSLDVNTLKSLNITGYRGNARREIAPVEGDFGPNLTLSGTDAPRGIALGSARIAGTWQVAGCSINADVGAVTVGSMQGALLLGCKGLTDSPADFQEGQTELHFTLRSLTVKGIDGRYFREDSKLGAWEIGALLFAKEETDPSGTIEFHEARRVKNVPQDVGGPGGEYDLFIV